MQGEEPILGFRVQGFGFWVWGLGCKGSGFWVLGLGFGVGFAV